MPQFCNVIVVNPVGSNLELTLALLKGFDNASPNGNADFGLRVTVTYVSENGTVETLDSDRRSIKNDTTLIGPLDGRTVAVAMKIALGTVPSPSDNASFSTTCQVLHREPDDGDTKLGPAEQTVL